MTGQIGTLKRLVGQSLGAFLKECQCGTTRSRNEKCKDLQQYEASTYVSYRGNQIYDSGDTNFPKLSSFYSQYIDDILDQIKTYFPGEGQKNKAKIKMSIFEALDHEKYPSSRLKIPDYVPKSIKEVSKLFGVNYNNALQENFNTLVTDILKNSIIEPSQSMKVNEKISISNQNFWCLYKKSDHLTFWIQVLEKFGRKMTEDLKLLLRKILVIPMGSGNYIGDLNENPLPFLHLVSL